MLSAQTESEENGIAKQQILLTKLAMKRRQRAKCVKGGRDKSRCRERVGRQAPHKKSVKVKGCERRNTNKRLTRSFPSYPN